MISCYRDANFNGILYLYAKRNLCYLVPIQIPQSLILFSKKAVHDVKLKLFVFDFS